MGQTSYPRWTTCLFVRCVVNSGDFTILHGPEALLSYGVVRELVQGQLYGRWVPGAWVQLPPEQNRFSSSLPWRTLSFVLKGVHGEDQLGKLGQSWWCIFCVPPALGY